MVGLVDHDHIRDLHHPSLQRLDRVSRAGHQHQHHGVGVIHDVDLRLPHADGLHEHVLAPGGVEQQRGLQGRLGEAAERAGLAIERMNTPASRICSERRMRSPSSAP